MTTLLHEFLTMNRQELIRRCRIKVATRPAPSANHAELDYGISIFLTQVINTLVLEQTGVSTRSTSDAPTRQKTSTMLAEISIAAACHGSELLQHGFTVEQVVHDYGDLCQAVTDLAFEKGFSINTDEFRVLNRCLDNAIADAVTEYAYQRDTMVASRHAHALNERLGFLAHELRNLVNTATLALRAIKSGNVGLAGSTGGVLDRSLMGLRNLIDKSLTEVRVNAGVPQSKELVSLAHLIAEVHLFASLEAQGRPVVLTVPAVDPRLALDADRDLILSAVNNLVQNALKFTKPNTEISLSAYAAGDRIVIDVADSCGGLPAAMIDNLFLPFAQAAEDQSGLGLGLTIARRSVEASNGTLTARSVPKTGCVFSINLPRHAIPV
jgi:signal transduction histidine kinase